MKDRVDYHFKTEVKDIIVEDNEVKGLLLANGRDNEGQSSLFSSRS